MIIDYDGKPTRLDLFLHEKFNDRTRSFLKNLIVNGDVLVNGKTVKAGYELKTGDAIDVEIPEPISLEVKPEKIDLDIVYEDEYFAVINKPKNMVVHPAVGNYSGTLVNALLYNIKDLSGINGVVRPGIVHRLDKNTTGLIVVAKNDFAHVELSKQISAKECHRIYRAVVEGNLKQDEGQIVTYIDRSKKNRLKMAVSDTGRLAQTNYKVLTHYKKYDYVEFELKTGRTHQIRVHCEYLHHPIVGDELYGSKTEKYYSMGQMLHAYKLILTHPKTRERMEFTAPIPEYMVKFLDSLTLLWNLYKLWYNIFKEVNYE